MYTVISPNLFYYQNNTIIYRPSFTSNRDGIFVFAVVESKPLGGYPGQIKEKTDHAKIRICVCTHLSSSLSMNEYLGLSVGLAYAFPLIA